MKLLLKWKIKIGIFFLTQSTDGKFLPVLNDGDLGSYIRIAHSIEDFANDATFSVLRPEVPELVDTSALKIPEDAKQWNQV